MVAVGTLAAGDRPQHGRVHHLQRARDAAVAGSRAERMVTIYNMSDRDIARGAAAARTDSRAPK